MEYQGDYGIQTWTQWAKQGLSMDTKSKNVTGCLTCWKNHANIGVFMVACKDRNKVDIWEDWEMKKYVNLANFWSVSCLKQPRKLFLLCGVKVFQLIQLMLSEQYITPNPQSSRVILKYRDNKCSRPCVFSREAQKSFIFMIRRSFPCSLPQLRLVNICWDHSAII